MSTFTSLHLARPIAALVVTLVPLAAGCSAQADTARDASGTTSAAIQGGELAPAAPFDFAVALVGRGLCSGTLIAPNLALTARHCLELDPETTPHCAGGPLVEPSDLRLLVGKEAAPGAVLFEITKIITAPETNGCVPDLALVQLAKVVPASVAKPARPAVDAAFRARPHYLPTVTAIGFGLDEFGEAGVRRIRRNIPVLCVLGDTQFDCGDGAEEVIQPFEMVAGQGPCQGDSGGGLYEPMGVETNDAVVVSVVSRGAIEEDGRCLEGLFVRVDSFHELLITSAVAAAAAGGYPVPVWAGANDVPVPVPPKVDPPVEEAPPPASPVPSSTTTTTTTSTGCGVRPARIHVSTPAAFGLLAAAVAGIARRRRRAA